LNDIQINGKKTKLIVMNSKLKKEEKKLSFGQEWIKEEGENKITRFLGIWLNCKLKESLVRAKAKEIVRATVRGLDAKKITISQVVYINNICIISKLCYILQAIRLSKRTIDSIHILLVRLAKNKMEISRSTRNSLVFHRNLRNYNALDDQLFLKQIVSLHNRLNTIGPEEVLMKMRIEEGIALAGGSLDKWLIENQKIGRRLWKNNLVCLIMLKAASLNIKLNISEKEAKKIGGAKKLESY
jgi:hypothetical protein